jgi:4-hydroxy-tetrahydrodipicolinate reductase
MHLIIVGHGKMGKTIEHVAKLKNLNIHAIVDNYADLTSLTFPTQSIVIDFTQPDQVLTNINFYATKKVNVVMGTTGWQQHLETVKKIVLEAQIGFIYASNFALGVNLFTKIIAEAARVFNNFPEYDVFMRETHHKHKKDAPSGTALNIGKTLLANIKWKKHLLLNNPDRAIHDDEIHISAARGGTVIGEHEVIFDSSADSISLQHQAKDRSGFALGAIASAQWVNAKKGFFTINDYIDEVLKHD